MGLILKGETSKKNPNITFAEAEFSEEGVTVKDLKTNVKPKKKRSIKGTVQRVFFSFIGEESLLEEIYCRMNYDFDWILNIDKVSLFQNTYCIHNFKLQNSKSFFIKAEKVSNVGKISVLNMEIGSNEVMGWKASSKFVNYDQKNDEITCLDNKFGIGKTKFKFFNLNFSKKPRSGWMPISSLIKDFGEKSYISFGYYLLSKNNDIDFSFYPMFYWKDLGGIFQIRSLKHNIEFHAQLERFISYIRYKNDNNNHKITPSNFVLHFISNNNFLDSDFYIFNSQLYNKKFLKNMNYQSFLPLDKDYWGFAYFNFGKLKLNILQRNSQRAVRVILDIADFFNLTAEETFCKNNLANLNLFKNFYMDIDLFLIDIQGKLSYKFVENYDYTKLSKENIKLKTNLSLDLPIVYLYENAFKFACSFSADGQIVDFVKHFKKEKKIHDDFILNLEVECLCIFRDFDLKFFCKNNKKFGLELANFQKYLDSFSIEIKNRKAFICFIFLEKSKSYGLKIAKDQILLEWLYTLFDCLKIQCLGSYSFKDVFFQKSNLYLKNTYINFGIELKTKSWKLKICLGRKNFGEQGVLPIYSISVAPIEQMSFSEIEEIFRDIDKEKEKILSLYDEF